MKDLLEKLRHQVKEKKVNILNFHLDDGSTKKIDPDPTHGSNNATINTDPDISKRLVEGEQEKKVEID